MAKTQYIWDPVNDTYLMEKDAVGNTMAVYTNQPGEYGPLISQHREGETSYYHFDGQRSTRELTDGNQTKTDTYTYTAFGETVATTGMTTNPFRYKGALGYYVNPESNDLYVRARVYGKHLGRWHTKDPLALTVSLAPYVYGRWRTAVRGNPYTYARSNPMRLWDPSGLSEEAQCGCCCCVEYADINDIRQTKFLAKPPSSIAMSGSRFDPQPVGLLAITSHAPPGPVAMVGHAFTHQAFLKNMPSEKSRGKCSIEWFECSDTGHEYQTGEKVDPLDWHGTHISPGVGQWKYTDWDDYVSSKKSGPCSGSFTLETTDTPAISVYGDRIAKFAIRISSAQDCPCDRRTATITATQTLIGPPPGEMTIPWGHPGFPGYEEWTFDIETDVPYLDCGAVPWADPEAIY